MNWNPFTWGSQKQNDVEQSTSMSRNPNYQTFKKVDNDIERIVASRSVIGQKVQQQQNVANPIWATLGVDSDMLLMPAATNKADRLAQYRSIACYPECDWCLNEIADEFIHEDENGGFINLRLPDGKDNLNETRKAILQNEFKHYINLFRLRDEGYNIIKQFLVEGELAWENVIDPKQPELGIRGVKFLPAEYYETMVDTKTNRPVGVIFDTEKFAKDVHEILSHNYLGAAQIFNKLSPSVFAFSFNKDTCVPMLYSQLTYINSGDLSHDKLVSFPIVEKARQAYHQLALLQEAAVILRVTRAPERLLFNVSTGRMADPNAHEYVRNFANSLKAKKVARNDGSGDIASVYNPVSMLEQYVFGKSSDSEGTSVESVGSSADYEQLGDIEYFLRRLMKQFKVPFSRYKTPENAAPTPDQLNYEEHSFLRMIVRMQRRFADGFKKGYITHLKLRGIWDKYNIVDEDIDVSFVKPSMYELLEVQKIVETKMNIYKASLGDDKEISKISGMKKYLGFSDAEIKQNFENLIKEKMLTELAEYYSGQVAEKHGLAGYDAPIEYKDDVEKAQGGGADEEKTEEGGEESSGTDEGSTEGSEGEEAEQEEAPEEEEKKEAPPPTFGLS